MVLREVVQELRHLANARGVTLVLECPDLPLYMQLDREKISLALAHLVDNATKFTGPGGVVRVVGGLGSSNQGATIEVRDTGVGITPRDLSRVFDRFYQVAPSATRAQTGLGIGLAIAKMFVELHGGQIQVQSVLGQGSVFQVRLPLVPAEQ
jgi:signal transduction histidine kinase